MSRLHHNIICFFFKTRFLLYQDLEYNVDLVQEVEFGSFGRGFDISINEKMDKCVIRVTKKAILPFKISVWKCVKWIYSLSKFKFDFTNLTLNFLHLELYQT
jgi:hypothetical protein